MKKNIALGVFLFFISVLMIPIGVSAEGLSLTGTTRETLQEAFDAEGITSYDLSNYSETGDKVVIYLFRKDGCSNCKNFLIYLKDVLLPKYGDQFKVISYELSSNTSNYNLLDKVAAFFNEKQTVYTTPYVVVGDQTFSGSIYYDSAKKTQIETVIQSGSKFDVIEEMKKGSTSIDDHKNFTDNGITFRSNKAFSSNYTLKVSPIDAKNIVLDHFNYIAAYDISMYDGGVVVPLNNGSFQIRIPVSIKYDTYKVAYVKDGGIVETFDAVYENDSIVFTTSHLSEYIVYGKNYVTNAFEVVNEENPQTLDRIQTYELMFIFGGMILLGSCFLYKKKKLV